jgi:hypothetical protein
MATTMTGYRGREVRALPLDEVGNLFKERANK